MSVTAGMGTGPILSSFVLGPVEIGNSWWSVSGPMVQRFLPRQQLSGRSWEVGSRVLRKEGILRLAPMAEGPPDPQHGWKRGLLSLKFTTEESRDVMPPAPTCSKKRLWSDDTSSGQVTLALALRG